MAFEASFFSVRAQRLPSDRLYAEYLGYERVGRAESARTAEIEYHMAAGNEHYQRRRYAEALREYKLALGLIFQLVEPRFDPPSALGGDVRVSGAKELFTPLVSSVLTAIDRSPDTLVPFVVGPPEPVDPFIHPPLLAYRGLGLGTAPVAAGLVPSVAEPYQLAVGYARAGEHGRSIPLYQVALQALGKDGAAPVRAGLQHELGVAYGEAGQAAEALRQLDLARNAYSAAGDLVAQAGVQETVAAVHTRAGQYGAARRALSDAEGLYGRAAAGVPQARGVDAEAPRAALSPHELTNATIRLTQQRNDIQALSERGSFLGRVAGRIRRALEARTVAQPALAVQSSALRDGGAQAKSRPVGSALQAAAGVRTLRVATGVAAGQAAEQLRIVAVALADPGRADVVEQQIYQHRIAADTLDRLGVGIGAAYLPDHFRVYIPHHYFFTIRVCLGDTYHALGQFSSAVREYELARGYRYLNLPIEASSLWLRTARSLLAWGLELYRKNEIAPALERFQRIVMVAPDGALSVPAASPLYHHAPFAQMQAAVAAFLPVIESQARGGLSPEAAVVVRQARVYQQMIHAGLNALGMPLDLIPIFRFRYLQAVARYFAEQAIKAEREYINFKSNSEQETAALLQLQQAEALAAEGVKLEHRRADEALAELALTVKSRQLAQERVINAQERLAQYAAVSADKVALDTASAHASGGFTETEGGYQVTLTSTGQSVNLGDEDYEIMQNAAWHRGMIVRQFELDDMQRTVDEYTANLAVSAAQVTVSQMRAEIANQNIVIADLRLEHARESREFAEEKTFNAELWGNLGDRMRELSQLYLDRATEIALLMQAAYNFESDTSLNKVVTSYATGEQLGGLLGGDALLADINYFTYHYITQTKSKAVPVKTIVSLAERYPFVLFQFRRSGVAAFETKLEDFDRMFPGSFMHRLRAVEVVVEGLIGADGLSGSVKNSGISTYRTRDNKVKVRVQPRETQFISSYSPRGDALVFRPVDETLGVFEGSGAATAWTLEIPPGSNDLNYDAVSDLKLVLSYDAFHDPGLEAEVRAALPKQGQRARSVSLRFNQPDAFFLLLEGGSTEFSIRAGDFPYNHTKLAIQRLALYAIPEKGGSANGVHLRVQNQDSGHVASAVTGVDGTVSSDPAGPAALNVFHGDNPVGSWRVSLDPAANPALFVEEPVGSGLLRVQGLRDVVLAIEYRYDVRVAAGV